MQRHVNGFYVTITALVLAALSAHAFAQQNDLPYKVYRIVPRDWNDVDRIAQIRRMEIEKQLDFWVDSNGPDQFADLMVPPSRAAEMEEFFQLHNLQYNVSIPDVQKLIYRNEVDVEAKSLVRIDKKRENASDPEIAAFLRRFHDAPSSEEDGRVGHTRADYPFGDYASYRAMMKYMRTIEFYYPRFTKLIRIGTTHEGRPIEGLKIGFPIENVEKRGVWIDGNIHAREWAASHTALFFINQLVAGYGNDREITDYIDNLNFFIVPNLNPDGYEYTRESPRPEVRLWRKNRSPEKCVKSVWGGLRCCQGVDLNRNFDFHWSETGSTDNPCSNLYHGSGVFSEPEANGVNAFLRSAEMTDKVDAFITLHTYAQLWIHPFSHELGQYPRDYHDLHGLAVKAAKRLESVYGTHFRVGTGADLLSPASGGSDDWAKGTLGIKYVYLLELRPELEVSRGFILHKSELVPTGVETFEALKEVVKGVLKFNNIDLNLSRQRAAHRPVPEAPRPPIVAQGVPNVVSQQKPSEGAGLVVNKVVFGSLKDREIVLISSSPNTTSSTMTTTTTTSTTTTTQKPTTTTTVPTTTTSTTTTTSPSTTTTPITTTVSSTTPKPTSKAATTTAAPTTTSVQTTRAPATMSSSREKQKLSYGQRLSVQLIRKQMMRLRNMSPTPVTSFTAPEYFQPTTTTTTRAAPSTAPSTTTTQTPAAISSHRTDVSIEESAVAPKIEPAIVFMAERAPSPQSTINRSAPRYLTITPNRAAAGKDVFLLPPLRSENPITGINEVVLKAQAPTTQAPLSSAVREFLSGASCKDMRYSCSYWIRSNPRVCTEQQTYMRLQCARSCDYCTQ